MSHLLHHQTPTLQVFDHFGQPVRAVSYYRHPDKPQDTATRITANKALRAGRISQSWDPRLLALAEAGTVVSPNFNNLHSLFGCPLLSENVDAGWRLTLWDALGQAQTTWDTRHTRTRQTYGELQRPLAVFERPGNVQPATERCVGRIHYADQRPQTQARNQCGQPIRVDDSAGVLLRQRYSLLGAPLSETRQFLQALTEPDWSREVLLEEGKGATTRWTYTSLGETLSQTDAVGNTQSSVYDVAGQLRESRLQLVGQSSQRLVGDIQYNALGQITSETAGNGVRTHSVYCQQTGRLLHLTAQRPDDPDYLQDLAYEYDPVGNIQRVEDEARPVRHCANQCIEPVRSFTYDSLDQLVSAGDWEVRSPNRGPALPGYQPLCIDATQLANYAETYTYDAAGNLQELKHVGAHHFTRRLTTAFGSNRSLLEESENSRLTKADIAAGFDTNGNLLRLQAGGSTLQWDLRNQLQQVSPVPREDGPHDTERYIYGCDGQRVRKVRRSQASGRELMAEVRYLPGLEIRRTGATGEVLHVISAPGGRSSVRVLDWQQWRKSEQIAPKDLQNKRLRYSLSDHLGSSTLELDDQANLLSQEGYYPYGGTAWWAAVHETEAQYKTIRYSGKERDATGLYYYGFRYYAPWLGRWINPDPAGTIDGLNLYRMASNNPVHYKDRDGTTIYYWIDPKYDPMKKNRPKRSAAIRKNRNELAHTEL